MKKMIKDANGRVAYWINNENDFIYNGSYYERDEYNGRCYRLEESTCLRSDCDGKLVRRRISAKNYAELLEMCKAELQEFQKLQEPTVEEPTEAVAPTTEEKMTINEMKAVMAYTKEIIAERQVKSSPYFYDDIWNEEVEWMCETYPAIDKLSGKVFQFLWKKA